MTISTPTSLGSNTTIANVTSLAITTSAAIVAGNLVVVVIANLTPVNPRTVTAVSDGTNTYTQATSVVDGSNQPYLTLWYKANAAAVSSSAALTATFSGTLAGTGNCALMCAVQLAGISVSPLDAAIATAHNSTGTATVTTGTLAQASEIVFGTEANTFGSLTPYTEGAGFTNLFNIADNTQFVELTLAYRIVAATTAVSYAPTTNNATWAAIAAPFKAFLPSASFGIVAG